MQSTSDITSRLAAIIQELTATQVVEVKAAQTGHSGKVLLEVYSRWLPGADGGRREGAVWLRSASGEILIDMEGYAKWCKGK